MAVKLTAEEQSMLRGELGPAKRLALEKIIRYAEILGAKDLVTITKAHLDCGIPNSYLGDLYDYNEVFTKRFLDPTGTVKLTEEDGFWEDLYIQDDVTPCDHYHWEIVNQDRALYEGNQSLLKQAAGCGVCMASTCAPYLTGWLPLRDEYFVTVESSNVLFCNSILGARGNGGGSATTFLSCICGRTPRAGLHLDENRLGTHVFNVHCPTQTKQDWDMLGYAVGKRLDQDAIPVLCGDFTNPDLTRLKSFFTTLATTSGVEMCHFVGFSPEAPDLTTALGNKEPKAVFDITADITDGYRKALCHAVSGPVDLLQIGCPHCTIDEIRRLARYMKGKKVKEGVRLFIETTYPILQMAQNSGYATILEEAGAHMMTSGCINTIRFMTQGTKGVGLSAGKLAHYQKSELDVPVYYGTDEEVLDAAIEGYWEVQ
ncbi:MAG: aconitase X [Eubacteriales bacterium]|nr:aconitase X [Eubacteriales bacterium]